jgi:hypothetical protein
MKWFLKWFFRLVILLVVLAVALALALDSIVRALAEGKLHVTLMRFNLAEVDVVRNEAGQTNTVNLTARSFSKPPARGGAKRLSDFVFTGIDVLNLSLGKLQYVDLKIRSTAAN